MSTRKIAELIIIAQEANQQIHDLAELVRALDERVQELERRAATRETWSEN